MQNTLFTQISHADVQNQLQLPSEEAQYKFWSQSFYNHNQKISNKWLKKLQIT